MPILFKPPSNAAIRRFRDSQQALPFTYPEVGATRNAESTPGYNVDHNRIRLGIGAETYARAKDALRHWTMFGVGWVEVREPDTPIEVGQIVAVVARHYGVYSLNTARIVYTVEEEGPICRFGFAYGTLPGHEEIGEERFLVEWDRADDNVWYDVYAFSRPGFWATLGYPLVRRLQRQFARQSLRAMRRACILQ